jgi:thiol-disulfide isomerase/thioredoxin
MVPRSRRPVALVTAVLALALPLVSSTRSDAGSPAPSAISGAGRAWFGVEMEKTADAGGVRVKHVMRGSPAEKAGLKDGDVLRSIDGARVTSPDEVTRIVGIHAAGDAVVASLTRAAESLSLRVALAPRPAPDEMLRLDRVGAFAPAWVGVQPIGDAPASLDSLRGKVVLLDFWATWCGPCRILAPKLSGLQARYGAQGLRVVGVTTDPAEKAALFAQRANVRYALAVDPEGDTSRAYAVSALPTVFVIDKRGVVRDVAVGYDEGRDAQLESLLKELLAEPAE